MGKSIKKSATKADAAVVAPTKSMKKGLIFSPPFVFDVFLVIGSKVSIFINLSDWAFLENFVCGFPFIFCVSFSVHVWCVEQNSYFFS